MAKSGTSGHQLSSSLDIAQRRGPEVRLQALWRLVRELDGALQKPDGNARGGVRGQEEPEVGRTVPKASSGRKRARENKKERESSLMPKTERERGRCALAVKALGSYSILNMHIRTYLVSTQYIVALFYLCQTTYIYTHIYGIPPGYPHFLVVLRFKRGG